MILDDLPQSGEHPASTPTLDDLFRRAAARRPDAIALIDPPNRASFTDGAPRRLTYAQADRIDLGASPARLRSSACTTDAVVGVQHRQHGRERAHAARGAARRPDRDAAAAAVAPCRRGRGAEPASRRAR